MYGYKPKLIFFIPDANLPSIITLLVFFLPVERHQASDIPVLQAPNTHELPAAPSQPVGSNITRTSLSLRWQAPGRTSPPLSPVTHYRLEYFSHEVAPGQSYYRHVRLLRLRGSPLFSPYGLCFFFPRLRSESTKNVLCPISSSSKYVAPGSTLIAI